ncbi:DUF3459 domain-containing protein [Streptomyces sp. NPDC001492]
MTKHQPQVVELAGCLSLAVSVDRGFLRRARLRFLPRTTAGLEAELWFSPLVEAAGRQALLLDPEAAEHLRTELARTAPSLLREIHAFTAAEHAHAPLVVRLYEDLLWSGLDLAGAEETQVARRAHHVLRTVSGQDVSAEVADDAGRWALHYAHRLPGHLLRRDDVWGIQVASCERLGLEPPDDPVGRPVTVTARARARVQHSILVGVTVRSDGVVLSRPPTAGSRIVRARGTRHKVRVDVRNTLAHTSEPVRLDLPADRSTHLPFTVVQRIGPEGDVRMSLSHPGTALDVAVCDHLGTGPGAAHCAVLLPDGTIVLHDADGAENGHIPADGPEGARESVALSEDGSQVSYVQDGEEQQQVLAPGSGSASGVPRRLSDRLGTVARLRWTDRVVQAFEDGRITLDDGGPSRRVIAYAPWRVSGLAVSDDEQWVAAVGDDSLLLEFPLDPDRRPRETRLRFSATWVSACIDGSWIVVGHGGPVELHTEDGRGYRVIPDIEPAADPEDSTPAWGRGCVLVRSQVGWLPDVTALPGVDCVLIRLEGSLAWEYERFAIHVAAAHDQGVRVVLGIDLSAIGADALSVVRRWLDEDVDGLALSGTAEAPAALLDDIRHLVDGYDDRMLLWNEAPTAGGTGRAHVVPASSLIATLDSALRSRNESGGMALTEAMALLRRAIRDTFPPSGAPRSQASFQWGLEVPPTVPPALRRLATVVLLSLPGCPTVPDNVLRQEDPNRPDGLPVLLELRRNHLALSRGSCETVDVGTPAVLAVVRRHGDDAVLCLVNVSATPAQAVLRPADLGWAARLQNAVGGSVFALFDGMNVSLHPDGMRWFRLLAT